MAVSASKSIIPIHELVAYRINALANVILRSASRQFMTETNLHPPEIWVLCSVGIHEPVTAREVANRMSIDEAQVSRAIKSLIAKKFINRVASADDNRRKLLSLSKEGKALYRQATRIAQGRQEKILDGLSERDIERLTQILDIVGENARGLLSDT